MIDDKDNLIGEEQKNNFDHIFCFDTEFTSIAKKYRLASLTEFNEGEVDYLCCTDLAARGLDIKGLHTVINYSMPRSLIHYIHRVGRTARAGKKGRSISFISSNDNKLVKDIIKLSSSSLIKRKINENNIKESKEKILSVTDAIKMQLKKEKEEKDIRILESKRSRLENLILHEDEIKQKPRKEWIRKSKRGMNESDDSINVKEKREDKRKNFISEKRADKRRRDDPSQKGEKRVDKRKETLSLPNDFSKISKRREKRKLIDDPSQKGEKRVKRKRYFDSTENHSDERKNKLFEEKKSNSIMKRGSRFKSKKRFKRR